MLARIGRLLLVFPFRVLVTSVKRFPGKLRSLVLSPEGILAIVLLFFLISQASLLNRPGLQEDEANFLVPSLELAKGMPITYGYSIEVLGIHYPTMVGAYTGNSLTLPVAIAVRIFGFSLALVRLLWIVLGAGTILFTFLACRELFNSSVGILAACLLAANPTFWVFTHVGAHASVSMTFDVVASLFFFLYFYRTQRRTWLFVAMFLVGHGLYTKLAFGYFLIAYLGMLAFLWATRRIGKPVVTLTNLLISLPAVTLGAWPFLYNLYANASAIWALQTALVGTQVNGQSNLNLGQNLFTRAYQTWQYLLEGHAPADMIVPGVPIVYDLVMPYLFIGCFLFLCALTFYRQRSIFPKVRIVFVLLVFLVFQVLIIFSPSSLNYGVYAFIPPFSAMILALGFSLWFINAKSQELGLVKWGAVAGVILLASAELFTLSSQYYAIDKTGGYGVWSSTVVGLTEYLMQHPELTPVALDWGLDQPVYVLSNLRVKPASSYAPFTLERGVLRQWTSSPPPDYDDFVMNLISRPSNVYLVRAERYSAFKGRLAVLGQEVNASGGQLVNIHSVYETNGQEIIVLYEAVFPNGRPMIYTLQDFPSDSSAIKNFPEIERVIPDHIRVGVPFNQQPNGLSAISIIGEGFTPNSVIQFNGESLDTVFGGTSWVTAFVPDKFVESAGEVEVSVVNHGRFRSNLAILKVVAK